MLEKIERTSKNFIFPLILNTIKEYSKKLIEEKKPIIVGVTGSAGKSSFISLLDSVMRDEMKTKTTFKGNSETGLPLEILGIRDYLQNYSLFNWLIILAMTPFAYLLGKFTFDYDLLIAEMGIDSSEEPKNMAYLLKIIKPDIGVFLSVSAVHSEQFASELKLDRNDGEKIVRAIAHEKGRIVTELDKKSSAIINIDSPFIQELIPHIQAKIITFGKSEEADYHLLTHSIDGDATHYSFVHKNRTYEVVINGYVLSEEYGQNILSVVATAEALGIEIITTISKLEERFTIPPGRMSLIPGKNGAMILDSSYNSSPAALRSLLHTLSIYPVEGKKILVLGDMRELGPLAEVEHRNLADLVAEVADQVVLVGPLMNTHLLPELEKEGVPTISFETAKGVGDTLIKQGLVHKKDVILVKGSQNTIFLEQVVAELMKNPSDAPKLLCRQTAFWDKIRSRHFSSTR